MTAAQAGVLTTERTRPVIALLEARMKNELERLVEKHGGSAVCVPAVEEAPRAQTDVVNALLDELAAGRHEIVIFMTGVAVSLLFELAQELGRHTELVTSLRKLTTVCRGPKPTAALRGFGVPPTHTAREPFTTAELIDTLSDLDVAGRGTLLFNYGERSETLSETLLARRANLRDFWLYEWRMPPDTEPLQQLVRRIVAREVDALAITCQIQFRHLYQVAERMDLGRELVAALREDVVVGAVGPTCRAIIEVHGVQPHVMPEHPKMGPLVMALMKHLNAKQIIERRAASSRLQH